MPASQQQHQDRSLQMCHTATRAEVCGPPRPANPDLRLGDTGPQTPLQSMRLLTARVLEPNDLWSLPQSMSPNFPIKDGPATVPHLTVTIGSGNFSVRHCKFGESSCGHSEGLCPLGDHNLKGHDLKDGKGATHTTCAGQIKRERTRSVPQPVTEGCTRAPGLPRLTAASVPHCRAGASSVDPQPPRSPASG